MSQTDIDGGWGWVVCFACFIVHVLVDGMQYSSGIIFVTLLDYFHESKSNTSFVASLAPSVCFITGPFVAVLVNRFGCRAVAIAGGLIASISQFISVFAPSIQFLYITLGIVSGIGYGVAYLPSIVAVNQYFSDKKRSIAIGLAVSGTGFGTFIFGPVINFLITTYTWQGAFLISSALMLNTVVCGMVYRPVSTAQQTGDLNISSTQTQTACAEHQGHKPLPQPKQDISESEGGDSTNGNEDVENMTIYEQTVVSERQVATRMYKHIESIEHDSDITGTSHNTDDNINVKGIDKTVDTSGQCYDSNEKKMIPNRCSYITKIGKLFKSTVLDSRVTILMRNIRFAPYVVHCFLYGLGFFVPYVYLPDMAIEAGIGKDQAAWLVSSIGIADTIGRVFFGFLAGVSWVNEIYLYSTAVVICGLAMTVGPLLQTFWALFVYAVVIGFFSGVAISLTSVVCIQLVGAELLPDAFGISLFSEGIASGIGSPLAGWMYDVSGSYLYSYIFAGLSMALSGVIMLQVPLCCGNTKQCSKEDGFQSNTGSG